jgi:hypothetical protein
MDVYFTPEQEGRLLQAAVDQGDADIEAGRYKDYAEDTLHQLFADVRRRGIETLAAQPKKPG